MLGESGKWQAPLSWDKNLQSLRCPIQQQEQPHLSRVLAVGPDPAAAHVALDLVDGGL